MVLRSGILALSLALAAPAFGQTSSGVPGVTVTPSESSTGYHSSFDPRPPKLVLGSANIAGPGVAAHDQPLVSEGPSSLDLKPRIDPAEADSYLNSRDFHDLVAPRSSRRESGASQIGGTAGAMAAEAAIMGLRAAVNGS